MDRARKSPTHTSSCCAFQNTRLCFSVKVSSPVFRNQIICLEHQTRSQFWFFRDVAWWLSDHTNILPVQPTKQAPAPPTNSVKAQASTNPAKYVQQEVEKLNKEISYLFRLQNLTDVTRLHLRTCCTALDQCFKVHDDKNMGHVQLWEFLNQPQTLNKTQTPNKTQCSRMKHLCMQYREKLSNLIVLAGFPVRREPSDLPKILNNLPKISYSAFRDQMIHRFKDTSSWKAFEFIKPYGAFHEQSGDFDQFFSTDWTFEAGKAGKIFHDVLGRFYDHASDLFGSLPAPCQEGLSQHINAFQGNADFATLKTCACKLYLPCLTFSYAFYIFSCLRDFWLFISCAKYELSLILFCPRSS